MNLKASYQGTPKQDLDDKIRKIIAAKYDGSGFDFGTEVRDHFWYKLSLDQVIEIVQALVGLNEKFDFHIRTPKLGDLV